MSTVPPMARSLTRSQLGLGRSLWWALRRHEDVGPTDLALRYNGLDRAVLWTISALGVLEIGVVHVLVSWPVLRWTLFVIGVYGLLGFIAFHFTMCQHPHLLRSGELVLRFGHFRSVRVPLDHLAGVRKHVRNEHKKTVELDGDALALSFMGGTNVELRFSPKAEVELDGRPHFLSRVAFSVDDPGTTLAALRARTIAPEP